MVNLSRFRLRNLFLFTVVLAILISTFLAGAVFYRYKVWPFGVGYYQRIGGMLGLRPREPERARKAKEARKAAESRLTPQTGYHKLKLFYFKEIPEGHLAVAPPAPITPAVFPRTEGLSEPEAQASSSLVLFHVSKHGEVRHLRVSIPLLSQNLEPKLEATRVGTLSGIFTEAKGKVNDVFTRRDGSVLVSYTTADRRKCASVKLDEIVFTDNFDSFEQKTVYKTYPCTLPPYGLHESGGRIAEDSKGEILLSVGDFARGDKALKDGADFGKILKLSAGAVSEVARGLRNPQGLFFDFDSNRLYSTEHGPRGGDEINIIEAGENYGWPLETYGFNYREDTEWEVFSNKGLITYGRHDRFRQPLLAFVPSIGIGQIAKMPLDSYEFPNWLGDFFVAGMASKSLYRIRIDGDRVIYAEPIELGRIRDFIISPEGVIIASSTKGLIVVRRAVGSRG